MDTPARTRPRTPVLRWGPTALLVGLLPLLGACGSEASEDAAEEAPAVQAEAEVPRTADPFARGYTEDDFPRVQEIAPGVYTYEQLRSAGEELFTTVSMFVVTEEGVLVADGQGSVEETRRLVNHIADVTPQPITHVVIGSDHGDHTAGNSAFPEGVEYLAHPTSAENMRRTAENRAPSQPEVPLPTRMVEDREVLELGGREIHVQFLGRAHTGGDLVVVLPEERIMFMSEAYLNRVFPAMRSAYPSEWVEMVERAQAMDMEIYVPGHGFVEEPEILEEELERFRQAMVTVIEEATRLHGEGLSLEEAQAQADMGELEEWSLVSSQKPRAIQQVYAELNGELP